MSTDAPPTQGAAHGDESASVNLSSTSSPPPSNANAANESQRIVAENAKSTDAPAQTDLGKKELSNAEKKKLAKAEKAAKRQAKKAGDGTADVNETVNNVVVNGAMSSSPRPAPKAGEPQKNVKGPAKDPRPHAKPSAAASKDTKTVPHRRQQSQSLTQDTAASLRQASFLQHLYGQPRRRNLSSTPRDVHPAVQALGMQIAHYLICGSHARCAATLLSLRAVIQDYKTPPATSLSRDLSAHHLSPQLSFIKSCRPFSIPQSNAIRWLKNMIAQIDPSMPEITAKNEICSAIDSFIQERLLFADHVINDAVVDLIHDGDSILTFGKSAVIASSLLAAKKAGRKFTVTVVDSRPLHEGKNLARLLARNGVNTTYCTLTGLTRAAAKTSLCFIGAHAVMGNASVYSRAGTAIVAMTAANLGVPVTVCAESIKFTEKIALDGVVMNELAPEDELQMPSSGQTKSMPSTHEHTLLLNPLYDITPSRFISSIVTELGIISPSSVPTIQRIGGGAQEII